MSETKITRSVEVTNEREKDSTEAAGSSILACIAKARAATGEEITLEDIGTEAKAKVRIREGDDRNTMIAAVRSEAARITKFTVVDRPESQTTNDEVYQEPFEDRESSNEALCLRQLEEDFKKGIVVINLDDQKTVEDYAAALKADKTAGTTWEMVKEKLMANKGALLKKASEMQGKGQLIGILPNGELCIRDRGTEPVIYAKDSKGNKVTITTDTKDRVKVMDDIRKNGQFANYWDILQAVKEDGYIVPEDSPNYEKKGIVAASEAVTGEPYVRSENGKEWRSAILNCGNVSSSSFVRVVRFDPNTDRASVDFDYPKFQNDSGRGAVRVLRG